MISPLWGHEIGSIEGFDGFDDDEFSVVVVEEVVGDSVSSVIMVDFETLKIGAFGGRGTLIGVDWEIGGLGFGIEVGS